MQIQIEVKTHLLDSCPTHWSNTNEIRMHIWIQIKIYTCLAAVLPIGPSTQHLIGDAPVIAGRFRDALPGVAVRERDGVAGLGRALRVGDDGELHLEQGRLLRGRAGGSGAPSWEEEVGMLPHQVLCSTHHRLGRSVRCSQHRFVPNRPGCECPCLCLRPVSTMRYRC